MRVYVKALVTTLVSLATFWCLSYRQCYVMLVTNIFVQIFHETDATFSLLSSS